MMGEKHKMSIAEGIEDLLKEVKLTTEDFQGKQGAIGKAHRKITEGILKKWREADGFGLAKVPFVPRGRTYGIDVIGRDYEHGKILMSVEVDTWHRPYGSWMKLLDIRSANKFWIYVTSHIEQKAKDNFKESTGEIRDLMDARKEEEATLGNFIAFLKTPTILDKEVLNRLSPGD